MVAAELTNPGWRMLPVVVAKDLTVVIGDEAVRLTPTEGFRLAERLIRRSTARMVEEEIGLGSSPKRNHA
jgi:hypothetical protein